MPATDRLLTKLQETLGEGPTGDLVAWVNAAGVMNRAEVRELADLYLGRLDERLERRFTEMEVRLERRLVDMDLRLERRLTEQDGKMEHRLAAVRVEMADRLSAPYRDILRWLFVFWAGTIIPLAGLMIALIQP